MSFRTKLKSGWEQKKARFRASQRGFKFFGVAPDYPTQRKRKRDEFNPFDWI